MYTLLNYSIVILELLKCSVVSSVELLFHSSFDQVSDLKFCIKLKMIVST